MATMIATANTTTITITVIAPPSGPGETIELGPLGAGVLVTFPVVVLFPPAEVVGVPATEQVVPVNPVLHVHTPVPLNPSLQDAVLLASQSQPVQFPPKNPGEQELQVAPENPDLQVQVPAPDVPSAQLVVPAVTQRQGLQVAPK